MPFIQMQGQFNEDFAKYCTHFTTFGPNLMKLSQPSNPYILMVWANCMRPDGNPPNIEIAGKKYRFRYSNIARANMATLAYLLACFTSLDKAKVFAKNNGLALVPNDRPDLLKARIVKGYIHDTVWAPPVPIKSPLGFILDYEVQDRRGPSVTLAFFNQLKANFPRIKKYLYTNNVTENPFQLSGLGGNELKSAGIFTGCSLLMYDNNFDLPAQIKPFGAKRNLFVTIDATMTIQSIQKVKNFVEAQHLLGVNMWRNGQVDEKITPRLAIFKDWLKT